MHKKKIKKLDFFLNFLESQYSLKVVTYKIKENIMPHILPADKKSIYPTQTQDVIPSRKNDVAVKFIFSILLNLFGVALTVAGNVASAEISNKIHSANKYDLRNIATDTSIGGGILAAFAILIGSLYVKNYPTLANLSRNRATMGCLLQVALASLIINAGAILMGAAINNRPATNYLHILGVGLGGGALVFGILMVLGEIENRLAWKKGESASIVTSAQADSQHIVTSTAPLSETAPLLGTTNTAVVPEDIIEERIHFRQSPLVEACFPSQPTPRSTITFVA